VERPEKAERKGGGESSKDKNHELLRKTMKDGKENFIKSNGRPGSAAGREYEPIAECAAREARTCRPLTKPMVVGGVLGEGATDTPRPPEAHGGGPGVLGEGERGSAAKGPALFL